MDVTSYCLLSSSQEPSKCLFFGYHPHTLGEPYRLGSVQVQSSEQHRDGGGNRGAEK